MAVDSASAADMAAATASAADMAAVRVSEEHTATEAQVVEVLLWEVEEMGAPLVLGPPTAAARAALITPVPQAEPVPRLAVQLVLIQTPLTSSS